MDLDSLRCFDAAATTLHFRAAARRVHLSAAAFSDRIRSLEEELSVSLFVRTSRRVELTDAGRRILPDVRLLLDTASRVRAEAHEDARPPPFELVIGTRAELGISWLCPSLAALERACPERTLHLYNGDTPDLLARLERGELDAVVSSARLTSKSISYATLHEERYVFVGTGGRVRSPDDVRDLILVDVARDLPLFRYLVDAIADSAPWPFSRIETMGGIGSVRRRLFDGGRVAVLPAYFVAPDLRAKRLIRLFRQVTPRSDAFRLLYRSGHPRERALLSLAEDLRKIPLR